MTIADTREKCKTALAAVPRDVLLLAILLLASSASFGLGYLAGQEAGGVGQGTPLPLEESPAAAFVTPSGQFVASKNGTKYYPPGCAAVDRISSANKVWFASAAAAQSAGYALATNCSGR